MRHKLSAKFLTGTVSLCAALGLGTGVMLVSLGSAGTASAVPPFSGSYTITYLSGPSHTATGTQCLVFTQTGSIDGFPNSGTWVATTFSGFSGNFVYDGSDLRFYGEFSGGSGVIAHHVKRATSTTLKGGFDDFGDPGTGAANDGRITLKKGCTAGASRLTTGEDPTH